MMVTRYRSMVDTRPCDVEKGDAFAMKVVAWVHADGSWAAYRGPSPWSDDRVALEGDVLLEEVGRALFYVLAMSGRLYGEL